MAAPISSCYVSCGCNKSPHCADWGRNNVLCYGSSHSVVICQPEVKLKWKSTQLTFFSIIRMFHQLSEYCEMYMLLILRMKGNSFWFIINEGILLFWVLIKLNCLHHSWIYKFLLLWSLGPVGGFKCNVKLKQLCLKPPHHFLLLMYLRINYFIWLNML